MVGRKYSNAHETASSYLFSLSRDFFLSTSVFFPLFLLSGLSTGFSGCSAGLSGWPTGLSCWSTNYSLGSNLSSSSDAFSISTSSGSALTSVACGFSTLELVTVIGLSFDPDLAAGSAKSSDPGDSTSVISLCGVSFLECWAAFREDCLVLLARCRLSFYFWLTGKTSDSTTSFCCLTYKVEFWGSAETFRLVRYSRNFVCFLLADWIDSLWRASSSRASFFVSSVKECLEGSAFSGV